MKSYKALFSEGIFDKLSIESFLLDKISSDEEKAKILEIINEKLTGEVLSLFVQVLKKHQSSKFSLPSAIDICGTGGSGLPRLNTSTIAAFGLSALGIKVAKHGNKAASGRFGSFDLLESLGINIHQNPEETSFLYAQLNLAFLFARDFHPLVGHFGNARKRVPRPTIFNYIGPLLNPVNTNFQIIGTPSKHVQDLVAEAACILGQEVFVLRGEEGLDEVSISAQTYITHVKNGKKTNSKLCPKDFGIPPLPLESVLVNTKESKIKLARNILRGDIDSPHGKLVIINMAFVIKNLGLAPDYKTATKKAQSIFKNKAPLEVFKKYRQISNSQNMLTQIIGHKYLEIQQQDFKTKKIPEYSKKDFKASLSEEGLSVIAEIKKASPSKGKIIKGNFNPPQIAKKYEANQAQAISVLCDEKYFSGSYEIMKQVSLASKLPILCKEFIIDKRQIHKARANGADAILLIAEVLDCQKIESFIQEAKKLKMDTLVEVHSQKMLKAVIKKTSAEIIGINNRNLKTFKVDINHTKHTLKALSKKQKRSIIFVSESGIKNKEDIKKLPIHTNAILIGEGVINEPDKIKILKTAKPLTKICGIKKQKTVNDCVDFGADFIGFNFVPTSKRFISFQDIKKLKIPEKIKTVGIFQNQSLDEVIKIAQKTKIDYVQLSGNEPISYIKKCPFSIIKGITVYNKEDLAKAQKYLPFVKYVLLESHIPGSGKSFPNNIISHINFPFLLAGGLDAQKVKTIPKNAYLKGFDAATKIETNGRKDPLKINLFITSCHSNN